jgi:hypothetical protein
MHKRAGRSGTRLEQTMMQKRLCLASGTVSPLKYVARIATKWRMRRAHDLRRRARTLHQAASKPEILYEVINGSRDLSCSLRERASSSQWMSCLWSPHRLAGVLLMALEANKNGVQEA